MPCILGIHELLPFSLLVACALAPTAFSAIAEALAKLTCTCDAMALAIVGPNGNGACNVWTHHHISSLILVTTTHHTACHV